MTDPRPTAKPRFLTIHTPAAAVIGFIISTMFWILNPSAYQIAGIGHDFDFYSDVYLPLAPLIVNFAGLLGAIWPERDSRPLSWWKWGVLFLMVSVGAFAMWFMSWLVGGLVLLACVTFFSR